VTLIFLKKQDKYQLTNIFKNTNKHLKKFKILNLHRLKVFIKKKSFIESNMKNKISFNN